MSLFWICWLDQSILKLLVRSKLARCLCPLFFLFGIICLFIPPHSFKISCHNVIYFLVDWLPHPSPPPLLCFTSCAGNNLVFLFCVAVLKVLTICLLLKHYDYCVKLLPMHLCTLYRNLPMLRNILQCDAI